MNRFGIATLVSLSLGLTGYAQSNDPFRGPFATPGKIVSDPRKVPTLKPVPMSQASKTAPEPIVQASAQVIPDAVLVPPVPAAATACATQTQGSCATCADASQKCTTPAKHSSGCLDCLKNWLNYRSSPTPCECRIMPTGYVPPLIAFFPCKGCPPFSINPNPWMGGCAKCTNGAAPVVSLAPGIPPTSVHSGPAILPPPSVNTPPNVMPNPMKMEPGLPSVKKPNSIQTTGYSGTTINIPLKPLSPYASSTCKTCSDGTCVNKSETAKSPESSGILSSILPGYRRLGGPKVMENPDVIQTNFASPK